MTADNKSFIRPDKFWRDLGLRANQTVAHLGCGAGFYIVPAARIVGDKGAVFGVDVLPDMLAEAEGRAEREGVADIITTIRADLESKKSSTIKPKSIDWVLVANILYQSDPSKVLAEAAKIAKPGGTIVVVEWDVVATPLGPPAADRIAKPEVITIADQLKLKLTNEFAPSPYHYGLLFTP